MIKTVLFDLDGTLVDSAPDLATAANRMRQARGLRPLPYEALREYAGKGVRGLLWASFRIPPEAKGFEAMQREFLEDYTAHIADNAVPMPGIELLLTTLESRGVAWGVVTNKAEHLARLVLGHMGWETRAKCLVGGDTIGKRKPDPATILEGMRRLGATPGETAYVGDDLRDMMAAAAAGVTGCAATWGYVGDGAPPSTWCADMLLAHPMDMVSLLG